MKPKLLMFILFGWSAAGSVFAAPNATEIPKTPEEWLIRMTDFSQNGSAFRDPRVFIPWTNAMTEPSMAFAAAQGVMDPSGWLNMANSMVSPDAYRNLAGFADPAVPMRWAAGAAMNPAFYTQMGTQMADPAKMARWMMMPFDPRIQTLGGQFLSPNFYMKWGSGAMDPRAWNLVGNLMHPGTYTGMVGTAMNPKSYGPTWGMMPSPVAILVGTPDQNPNVFNKWLTHTPTPTMSNSNPWGTTTNGAYGFNFFDPQAMLAMVGGAIPGVANMATGTGGGMFGPAGVYAPGQVPLASTKVSDVTDPASVKPAEPVANAKADKITAVAIPAPVAAKSTVTPPAATVQPAIAASNRIVLPSDTLFKAGQLTKEGKKRLDETAAKIKTMGPVEQVVVIGHADQTGKPKSNRALSVQRAKAVKSYLVAKGVKPETVVSSGLGDTQPVAKCDSKLSKEDKIKCNEPNRRVEIEVRNKAPK